MGFGGAVGLRGPARAPHAALACVLTLVALALAAQPPSAGERSPSAGKAVTAPLTFVANAGQTDPSVRFMSRGAGHAFYFTADKAVLDLRKDERAVALELRFRGANPAAEVVAERRLGGRVNY